MAAEESPEQIRERVHAEELAKGSDPRVAEGRAKAAELRAKAGLPIEPDKAWRAKLEQEGGEQPAAPATAEAEPEAEPSAEAESAAEAEPAVEGQPAAEAEAHPEAAAPEPAAQQPAEAPAEPAAEPARPALRVVEPERETVMATEPEREPEVGEPFGVETEGLEVIAGVAMRDARLPRWLVGALLAILVWALAYALFLSGSDVIERTTRCRVEADQTLVCSGVTLEPSP
jgi:hypothetical protein